MACGGCKAAREAAVGALRALASGETEELRRRLIEMERAADDKLAQSALKQRVVREAARGLARLGASRR